MITEGRSVQEKKACIHCDALLDIYARFCGNCGTKQTYSDEKYVENKWKLLKQVGLFFSIDVVICVFANFVKAFDTLPWLLFFEINSWVLSICFFVINWQNNKYLLKWESFSWQKLSAYCALAVGGSFVVHYSAKWLNIVIFSKNEGYFHLLKGNPLAEITVIFLTAITPALFEELAYRGYLLQTLLKIMDKQQAIYISAFLFAIIHMSFISLFWLIPFALFLGVTRIRENTLWYGILFHFCFNLTACLFELL